MKMEIIEYDEKYRDDMIFTVLLAKDALGRIPRINEDLLDINTNYISKGDMFWLALENGRVIGCVGYSSIPGSSEAVLHRLYVKPSLKRKGIGSCLLEKAEDYMRSKGKTAVLVHLGEPKDVWYESYSFYPKHGYVEYEERHMRKVLV